MKNEELRTVKPGNHREAGYTMVMFVMIIAVMSISMGVAVQTAEFQMKREREAELIFRGQQYIEAIRLYKTKYGRYPMQLKEIWEAKPRVIRKKWKDPITDSEDWGIIFLGQEGQQVGQQGRQLSGPGAQGADSAAGRRPVGTQAPYGGADNKPGQPGFGGQGRDIDPQTGLPRSSFGQGGSQRMMGPIVGVHSKSTDEAVKIYEGHTTYSEWRFIYREQPQPGGRQGGQQVPPRPTGPPVGWHPGDQLGTDDDGRPVKIPPGGDGANPVPTQPRP